ncbi:hypothetical protein SASPL_142093 [Salvia splendens]|uniref:Bidirectional sugar transporter SWEET n=1 Tax=Salvia splendens TaxID=180675 RepID=A0A8X8WKB2_SALSN|nr:hypothetical protein SASPL_142093 [Salvia splendens]
MMCLCSLMLSKQKSVKYMPFWLIVAGFANGITWFTYGLLETVDAYIAVGVGWKWDWGIVLLSSSYLCLLITNPSIIIIVIQVAMRDQQPKTQAITTIWSIYKNKSIMNFLPYSFLAAFMNCILWILYGMPFVHPDSTLVVTINSIGLALEIIYLIVFMIYANKTYRKHVIETKNAESMQFWLCLSGFLNGGIWFCYAFLKKFDPYIAAGNGIGGLFGAIQLLVYAFYYFKAKNNVANDGKQGDAQRKLSQIV